MAEPGLIEKLLGAEGVEDQEPDNAHAPLDPVAAAAAMKAARTDPVLSQKAAVYFDKQTRFVEVQTEHLHEQREVQISHLRIRRLSDRLKAVSQAFFILVVGFIVAGIGFMLFDAFTSRSVVVDAFNAPSALAARSFTGDVGRYADAVAFLPDAFRRAPDNDRQARLAEQWGNALESLGRPVPAADKYRLAISLMPYYWVPRVNLIFSDVFTAGEEAGWQEASSFMKAALLAPEGLRANSAELAFVAPTLWDYPAFLKVC